MIMHTATAQSSPNIAFTMLSQADTISSNGEARVGSRRGFPYQQPSGFQNVHLIIPD